VRHEEDVMRRKFVMGCVLGLLGGACPDTDAGGPRTPRDGGSEVALDAEASFSADSSAPDSESADSGSGGNDARLSCLADVWTSPEESRRSAACAESDLEPAEDGGTVMYCSCDLQACPPDANGTPEVQCAQRVVARRCAAALMTACKLQTGANGYCEADTPRGTERCWNGDGGEFVCACAGVDAGNQRRVNAGSCTAALAAACD
jgi:hypothetical protein